MSDEHDASTEKGSSEETSRAQSRKRGAAEKTVLFISCVLVGAVIALILLQLRGDEGHASPHAVVEDVRRVGRDFHVQVKVTNEGDRTAANVQVSATDDDNSNRDGDQIIDFLAGGEDHELVFVFHTDPRMGHLAVRVTGFALP